MGVFGVTHGLAPAMRLKYGLHHLQKAGAQPRYMLDFMVFFNAVSLAYSC